MQPMVYPYTMRPSRFASARPSAQHGSLLIQFAVFLSVMVLILGVVDLGYAFYAKRDLQRIADLAALEAVQGIDANDSAACNAAGSRSVQANWPLPITAITTTAPVVCGEWDKVHPAPQHFLASNTRQNAARVVLAGETPRFVPVPWSRLVRAEAIAQRSEATVTFQVGSQLLSLDNGAPLGQLLRFAGLNAEQLSLLDHKGLVNAKISPSGLLKALGFDLGIGGLAVLTPDQLLRLNDLTLLHILKTSLTLMSDQVLAAKIQPILENINFHGVKILDKKSPLLGDISQKKPGLVTFLSLGKTSSPNGAALDAQIAISNLINTSILIAAQNHAIKIPNLNVLGIAKADLTVVEPPTIASGPVGTQANSAQVRLRVELDTNEVPLIGSLLGGLLEWLGLGIRIHLPLKIDGVRADAKLVRTHSCSKEYPQGAADIEVVSRVVQVTIGNPAPDNTLIKVTNGIQVKGPVTVDVLETPPQTLEFVTKDLSQWTDVNPLHAGKLLDSLSNAIFSLLKTPNLLAPVTALLSPLLDALGEYILSPLLTTILGIKLGSNEVKILDINCNSAELVF